MDSSVLRKVGCRAVVALLALSVCMGTMQAANVLRATPTAVSINCDPGGNSTTATLNIKAVATLSGTTSITVGLTTLPSQITVTPSAGNVLNTTTQAAGLTYTVAFANGVGCANLPASVTFNFKAGTATDVGITVSLGSVGFTITPSLVTLTCTKSGATYTPGPAQTISITSTTLGGTTVPFSVSNTSNTWITPSATTGTASSTATTFTLVAAAGCNSFASGTSNQATITVADSSELAITKTITVILKIQPPTPLTFTPAAPSLTYVKGSGNAGKAVVSLASANSPAPFFTVNPATLPSWLTVDTISGNTPKAVTFSTTTLADALAPGTYSASITISVSGYADLSVPLSLLITNKAPTLSVSEGITRNLTWVQGAALPTPYVTAVSSDSPIPYTVSTGGVLQPAVSAAQSSGLAYSFGTPIAITFSPVVFASAQPGQVLTGTVSLTWGTPAATIVVTFNVSVQSAGATVSGISPAGLPTAPAGQTFQVVLTGSGFVGGTDPSQKTKVGIVPSGSTTMIADTNIATNVLNSSNMILTITVPSTADTYLPFSPTVASGTPGGVVTLGVCNPVNGACTVPTGTITITIGSNPIIQAITSASSFTQVTPPTNPTFAPYDMITIFGTNFCSSGGTGCASSQVLYGSPSTGLMMYPSSLTPDPAGPTQRLVTVSFLQHGTTTLIANAPLLFATNSQINLMVPSGVSSFANADVVVNFGYGTGATLKSSAPFTVNVAPTDPGVFTVGQDGQGSGAILDATWNIINNGNPGGMRSTGADSDVVALYMTGLGAPDGPTSSTSTWSDSCISVANFLSALNAAEQSSITSLDGVVMQSALLPAGDYVPCIKSTSTDVPTVTVGGAAATVVYAGWVADTIAGLYQVNVKLPATTGSFTDASGNTLASGILSPVQLPVVVTANGVTSQPGVTIWVAPRLKVAAPGNSGLSGTVGVAWPSSTVVATEGTAPYTYAVTSGVLPSGLALNTSTGAITGTPAANTAGSYSVTVTATDSAHVPVTGTVTFSLTVAGGLYMTTSAAGPFNYVFGTAQASFNTVTATGGTYPYTYSITSPASLPTGMSLSGGALSITALTPGGTYPVTISASDSAATPLTGSANFTVTVALNVTNTAPAALTGASGGTLSTVSATGNTGTVSYAPASGSPGWLTVNSSTGVVSVAGSTTPGTYTVTIDATDGTTGTGSSAAATGSVTITFTLT